MRSMYTYQRHKFLHIYIYIYKCLPHSHKFVYLNCIYIYIYNETRSKLFYIHTCTDLCIYIYIYTEGFIRNDKLFICSTKNEH